MRSSISIWIGIAAGIGLVTVSAVSLPTDETVAGAPTAVHYAAENPDWRIEVTPAEDWQPSLPPGATLGEVSGVTVAADDSVWVVHRPRTVSDELAAAPSLLHLAPDGSLISAMIVPGEGAAVRDWPQSEHGLFIDAAGTLWLTGNGQDDSLVIALTEDGQQVARLGAAPTWYESAASDLGSPADIWIDPRSNIAYVADGYRHRRVAAFSVETTREVGSWQAHGGEFGLPVHCVRGSSDGRLYVCDRAKNRIQVFDIDPNGNLSWRSDIGIAPGTRGNGAAWDVAFSPDERLLYVADGENQRVWLIDRVGESIIGHFGRKGTGLGEFDWIHHLDVDSLGNLYTTEVQSGRRVQKFKISVSGGGRDA